MNVVAKQTLRSIRAAAVLAAAMLVAAPSHAAALVVHVTADGRPLADAVVTAVAGDSTTAAHSTRVRPKATMVQQFQQFAPFVLPIQVGTTVDFPNRDPFRHHVYSFSAAKSFELKLYGGDQTETVTFDKEGIVALGCNIHDNMLAYIYVVGTPYFVKTGADGAGTISDLPAGTYAITVWHPDQKGGKPPEQQITLAPDAKGELSLATDIKPEHRQRRPASVDESAY
ncbi:MAG: methylamine utilization protein [Rhodospirillaceae bacterium]|nr:MAG: methylamine utilization protein [Rhodospirillaceae bacterium]